MGNRPLLIGFWSRQKRYPAGKCRPSSWIVWIWSGSVGLPSSSMPFSSTTRPRMEKPIFSTWLTPLGTLTLPMRCLVPWQPVKGPFWWWTRPKESKPKPWPMSTWPWMRIWKSCRLSTRLICQQQIQSGFAMRLRMWLDWMPQKPSWPQPRLVLGLERFWSKLWKRCLHQLVMWLLPYKLWFLTPFTILIGELSSRFGLSMAWSSLAIPSRWCPMARPLMWPK